ncbi:MAG: undecaprenyl-diphosphate phosphatase [Candidatus Nanohaloarchaea archaeon]|nr:undecaprenyl-diphosphate phosphatase [Candidatus Nanohaloarchaea archaeon]
MTPLEAVVLGVLQGVFEWLPVSSEAILTVALTALGTEPATAVAAAVWLHTGTMLAALLYFRTEFSGLLRRARRHRPAPVLGVIVGATLVTGAVGGTVFVLGLEQLVQYPSLFAAATGVLLLVTGVLHLVGEAADRVADDAGAADAVLVGALQGLAILPGVSRSGITVFGFLYRDFTAADAFRLSFLLSVPAVLAANIGLELLGEGVTVSPALVLAAGTAAVVGYASIDVVLRLARRTGVALLCFILAALAFISAAL